MKHYCENVEAVLAETDSRLTGLTAAEAEHRLTAHGRNKLATAKKDSLLKRILLQMVDPMILILLAAAIVSAAIAVMEGGEGIADVVIILTVVFVNAFLGVFQESKAEKAIEALQEMAAATSRVLRDGQIAIVKSEELVPGDIVLLEAGDAIPADGRIIESASLKIEEAALTGESVPVTKHVDALTAPESGDIPLGDRKNMVYMGSTVAYGRGVAVITATGMDTEMGKIAGALAIAREGKTPLQLQLTQLSKILTVLVLGVCAIIFAVGLIRSEPILDSFLIAVSLAVAAIPEGLVAVVTVVLDRKSVV